MSLVGGKVDNEGNSSDILERTLKREVFEEVGIQVCNFKYVNSSSFVTDTGVAVVDIVFLCDHKHGEAYAKSSDEVEEVIWMTTEDIISGDEFPGYLKENIKLAYNLATMCVSS